MAKCCVYEILTTAGKRYGLANIATGQVFYEGARWKTRRGAENYAKKYGHELTGVGVVSFRPVLQGLKTCISLKELYEAGFARLKYGGTIEHTPEEDGIGGYYDLYRDDGLIPLCDGEEVQVFEAVGDTVVVETMCPEHFRIWFSAAEFAVAAFV